MLRAVVLVALATLAGCGAAPRHAGPRPEPARAHNANALPDNSVTMPHLGTLIARCPQHGAYTTRFVVDPERATDQLTVRVARRVVARAARDPGKSLTVRVRSGRAVVWRIVQESEPHTIRGSIRVVLLLGDEGRGCTFKRLATSLVTHYHH